MDLMEEKVDINPGLEKIYNMVLPHLGHDMLTAPGDLVDNALDAGAKNVKIYINEDKESITQMLVADDGDGMDKPTLHESNRIGAAAAHNPGDNGKFGTGGSIASFTLGGCKTTYTRSVATGTVLKSVLSLEALGAPDPLILTVATSKEIDLFNGLLPDTTGTLISIDDMKKNPQYSRAYTYAIALQEYFGMTYYNNLDNGLSINIFYTNAGSTEVKKLEVEPLNPIYYNDPERSHTSRTQIVSYEFENSSGEQVQSDIILYFTRMNTAAIRKNHGLSKNQGLVLERNRRVICRGKTPSGIWSRHPHLNGAGVLISFGEELDEAFGVKVTKNDVNFSEHLTDVVAPEIKKHLNYVKEIYADGSSTSPEVKELSKADDKFSKALQENGASIGLPEVTTTSLIGKGSRNPTGTKKGTVTPMGTGRRQSGTAKSFNVPRFEYISEPRTPVDHWPSVDEDGTIVVFINTAHPFVEKVFIKGNESTQDAMRALWAASGLAHYDYKDTPEETTTASFAEKLSNYLTKIYKRA